MEEGTQRFVIVNADDFGLTNGVNRGIIEVHERGIVTSASLMVRYPAAKEAAEYARRRTQLSVGLHLDLGEWRYRDGEWFPFYQVVDADDPCAVRLECHRQLREFHTLLGAPPTHIDSHQHVHLSEPVRTVVNEIAAELGVSLRSCSPSIRYCGGFYGQTGEGDPYHEGIAVESLVRMVDNLSPGWTEIGCHPGFPDDLDSVYLTERAEEVRVLCSDAARAALQRTDVRLRSFRDFPADR